MLVVAVIVLKERILSLSGKRTIDLLSEQFDGKTGFPRMVVVLHAV